MSYYTMRDMASALILPQIVGSSVTRDPILRMHLDNGTKLGRVILSFVVINETFQITTSLYWCLLVQAFLVQLRCTRLL